MIFRKVLIHQRAAKFCCLIIMPSVTILFSTIKWSVHILSAAVVGNYCAVSINQPISIFIVAPKL